MKKITGLLLFASFALFSFAAPDGKKKSPGEGKRFPNREQMIKKFDKDGDGKLSEEERAAVREEMKGRKGELLAKFDKDGDGELNDEGAKPSANNFPVKAGNCHHRY